MSHYNISEINLNLALETLQDFFKSKGLEKNYNESNARDFLKIATKVHKKRYQTLFEAETLEEYDYLHTQKTVWKTMSYFNAKAFEHLQPVINKSQIFRANSLRTLEIMASVIFEEFETKKRDKQEIIKENRLRFNN